MIHLQLVSKSHLQSQWKSISQDQMNLQERMAPRHHLHTGPAIAGITYYKMERIRMVRSKNRLIAEITMPEMLRPTRLLALPTLGLKLVQPPK
jgi:hypothetical protein